MERAAERGLPQSVTRTNYTAAAISSVPICQRCCDVAKESKLATWAIVRIKGTPGGRDADWR